MTDEQSHGRLRKRAWILLGILLGIAIAGLGTAVVFEDPYQIGAGVSISNPDGPTIHISEPVEPTSSDQSPSDGVIDLRPHAVFEGSSDAAASVRGWDDDWLVLDNLSVDGSQLVVKRGKQTIKIEGGAQTVQVRDYRIDNSADIIVDTDTQTTINATVPDTTAEYIILKDADTGERLHTVGNSTTHFEFSVSQDRRLDWEIGSVLFENPNPSDEETVGDRENVEISANISHPSTADGSITVEFVQDDGTIIDSQSVSSNGRVSTTWSDPANGSNSWYLRTDDGSQTHTSPIWTFKTPNNIDVRNLDGGGIFEADDGIGDITLVFRDAETGSTYERVWQSGSASAPVKFSMDGIPPDATYLVTIKNQFIAERTILIEDIGIKQTHWTTNLDNIDQFNITLTSEDLTDTYPPESSTVRLQRSYNISGNQTWAMVNADVLGTNNRMTVKVEQDARYRFVIQNENGDKRAFTNYLADTPDDLVTLRIEDISIVPPEEDGYLFRASEKTIETDNGTREAIRFIYRDSTETTQRLRVYIHQQNNQSNVLYGSQTLSGDTISETILIPPDQEEVESWVVNYKIDREVDNETTSGRVFVGNLSPLNIPLGETLLQTLGLSSILLVAGLFGGRLSKIGGIVTVAVAWVLSLLGILTIPPEFLIAAGVVAILFHVGASKPEVSPV